MTQSLVIQRLLEFIVLHSRQPLTAPLTETSQLIELGIIDSVVVLALANFIEEEFSVLVPDEGIPVAKLTDLQTLAAWLDSLPTTAER